MSEKIANRDAREYVQNRKPFEGSNLYAVRRITGSPEQPEVIYIVYSYGEHYPLFIHIHGQWFTNEDKYSPTTSKHRSQSHPHADTFPLSTQWMRALAEKGYKALAQMRVVDGVTWI